MVFSVEVAGEVRIGLSGRLLPLGESSATGKLLDSFDEFSDAVAELPRLYPLCQEERVAAQGVRKALAEGYVALYAVGDGKVSVVGFSIKRRTPRSWCEAFRHDKMHA